MRRQRGPIRLFIIHSLAMPLAASAAVVMAAESEKSDARQNPAKQAPGLVQEKPRSGPYVETPQGFMVPYQQTISGTDVTFQMVPIPGGVLRRGSGDASYQVQVEPFWMGKYEITWAEYKQYMALYDTLKRLEALREKLADARAKAGVKAALKGYPKLSERLGRKDDPADAITAPTKLYDPSFTYKLGEDPRQPASTMTQYSARQYTKWLSGLTGQVYLLPTEAQWEHAALAGAKTAWHFGDDAKKLGDYAWYFDNADETTHKVGQKTPNPWGLYDMHGNVGEWTLDQMVKDRDAKLAGKKLSVAEAVSWPTKEDPRIIKGGHWDDDAEKCTVASRMLSASEDWKDEDPNLPLSPWWFTTDPARGVGFRILRPLESPGKEFLTKAWNVDSESVRNDVGDRLKEGRGTRGVVDRELPGVVEQLKAFENANAADEAAASGN